MVHTIFGEELGSRFLVDGLYCAKSDSRGYYDFQPSGVHGSQSPPLRFTTKILKISQMTYAQILHLLVSSYLNHKTIIYYQNKLIHQK